MLNRFLSKLSLLKTMRVLIWISCFLSNSIKRLKGPLTAFELLKQKKNIISAVQLQKSDTEMLKINQKQFNLKVSVGELYYCFGRIQRAHCIFNPKESI